MSRSGLVYQCSRDAPLNHIQGFGSINIVRNPVSQYGLAARVLAVEINVCVPADVSRLVHEPGECFCKAMLFCEEHRCAEV